jgi:hypothetical protein
LVYFHWGRLHRHFWVRVSEDEGAQGGSDDDVAAAAVEPVALSSPPVAAALVQQQLVVGYTLTKKKVNSFLQAKLLPLAK